MKLTPLPLVGNSLLGCCCRAKSQGEETYSTGTEEQAHRACPEKKSRRVPSRGIVKPGGDATLWEACCVALCVMKTSPHVWNLTCSRQILVRNCGDSQCGVSLRPRVLLRQRSTPSPSSCSLFSQISDKFLWLPACLSCTQHFFSLSPSSTILCNCCSKLRRVPNEAPFLPSMCRHPTPIN